jgi:hypothetical protein
MRETEVTELIKVIKLIEARLLREAQAPEALKGEN